MDMSSFADVIASLGFPIACAIALGWFCYFIIKKVMDSSEAREEKLYKKIGECQDINKMAIQTIASYAERLDNIQNDIKEIKDDVLIVKTRMES